MCSCPRWASRKCSPEACQEARGERQLHRQAHRVGQPRAGQQGAASRQALTLPDGRSAGRHAPGTCHDAGLRELVEAQTALVASCSCSSGGSQWRTCEGQWRGTGPVACEQGSARTRPSGRERCSAVLPVHDKERRLAHVTPMHFFDNDPAGGDLSKRRNQIASAVWTTPVGGFWEEAPARRYRRAALLLVRIPSAARTWVAPPITRSPILQRDGATFGTARVVVIDRSIGREGGMPRQGVRHQDDARRSAGSTRRSVVRSHAFVVHRGQR